MAWVAGADVTTGDLITAAQWNNYLGATGSLEYLHDMQTWAQNDVTASRAIDGTIYQNTKDWIIVVQINVELDTAAGDIAEVDIFCAAATPPATPVCRLGSSNEIADIFISGTIIVLPAYYYRATENVAGTGVASLRDWFEWGPA